MCEFGIDAHGIDISENAISEAKNVLELAGFNTSIVSIYDGQNIPFNNNFFDFTISEGVIDSLPFSLAKKLLKEIERVTKKFFYFSLISSSSVSLFNSNSYQKDGEFNGEFVVQEKHEFGTIQSFYNMKKIKELIKETKFQIVWGELIENHDIFTKYSHGRYHLVLEKIT
ncbi:class I SAM-dependent methyltransferase [Helicobacter anseris]|nr:class I SAM-dependent methyltransferase [Helicobacter anseris]